MQGGVAEARKAGLPNDKTALEAEEQIVIDHKWPRKPLGTFAQALLSQDLLNKQLEF
jgi:hypothetical protein